MSRKKKTLKACDRCGSLMAETETGRQCPTCGLTEWISEGGEYTSGVAKCPVCGNLSSNIRYCIYCGERIEK